MNARPNRARMREWYVYLTLTVALFFAVAYFFLEELDPVMATLSAFDMMLSYLYWKDLRV